ncbi:MAG TPA: ATP-dependent RecD-like DNA helicase [Syntrophus sp. (in: bacteria)]|nr:ATP-dependent RecD-like DNA helicase [Syntrophus sp. (in: bacteria)]
MDLQGQIENVTYFNEETGYTIAKVKVAGNKDLVPCVGNLIRPTPGEVLSMKGEWTNHEKYGRQFKSSFSQTTTPASVHGIQKYLGSGLIKGIGPVMSKRIVAKFGKDTLEIIEHRSERLAEIPGIGEGRIGMIRKAWQDQKEIREVMLFLQTHGVSSGFAAKIFKQYGNDAIGIVQENPYRLAKDIFGIGFLTADKIAGKMGFAKESLVRAEAGILYVLNQLAEQGHVYAPQPFLLEQSQAILGIGADIIEKAVANLVKEQMVSSEERPGLDHRAIYLSHFYLAECQAAARLKALIPAPKQTRQIDVDKALGWVQEKLAITLAEKQLQAVKAAIESKLMIITGGPGTGKTTIINAIMKIYKTVKTTIFLAAPTGRAAKKMAESTGQEAKTIHRMLEFNFKRGGFQKNENSTLDCDILIVDEASMIDIVLMHYLLKAVPTRATLILVGDVNQLPSVGPGNVLRDIIAAGVAPVVELNEIFRQAKESSIIVNAHRINQGLFPETKPTTDASGTLSDFYFIQQEDPEKALETILNLVKTRIPMRFKLNPINDIQVLSPMNRGTVGVTNLNTELQQALNPGEGGVSRAGKTFRIHDKVMQIRNNYDKEVFNGDIGRIFHIDAEDQEIKVLFDERLVAYEFADLDELVPAYAVTVHKSQGSEYPAVVIPIMTQHYMMLQRNLIYTAVTRGRKLVVLVGTKKALAIAVKNNKTEQRYSLLRQRLTGN